MTAILALIFGTIALVVISALWRAWVLTVLWTWFIVPLGLPAIGIATAIGASLIVGMFMPNQVAKKDTTMNKTDAIANVFSVAIGGPAVVLLIGWIVTLFM